jgi:outer membrane protein, multidrug efflux system
MHRLSPLIPLLAIGLSSCLVGPNYTPPRCTCDAAFEDLDQEGVLLNTSGVVVDWWTTFEDPLLDKLLSEAVSCNLRVQEAATRIWETRARRRLESSLTAPAFVPGFTISRTRDSRNILFGNFGDDFNEQLAFNEIELGFDIRWEIDLWGRNKRKVEAADARLCASVFNRRAVVLSLMGEVASTYAEIRGFQKRLELARKNVEIQTDVVTITQMRTDAGITDGLDPLQAQTLLQRTEAEIPVLQYKLEAAINRIALLLGRCPPALWEQLHLPSKIPVKPPLIPVGLPSELVRRRPDLQRAERELAAATADIGVVVADYFPRFSLTQALGLAAHDPNNLFEGKSLAWQVGAALLGPIIQGGKLRANVCLHQARARQAFFHYEEAILEAFEEVRRTLLAYHYDQERLVNLKAAMETSLASFEVATALYTSGLTDFLDVLEAQRSMLVVSDQLAATEAQIIVDAVQLFKALGGGWELGEKQ